MLLVANSTPMVDFDSRLNSLRVNLERRLLLPTPESPIRTTEKKRNPLRKLKAATLQENSNWTLRSNIEN